MCVYYQPELLLPCSTVKLVTKSSDKEKVKSTLILSTLFVWKLHFTVKALHEKKPFNVAVFCFLFCSCHKSMCNPMERI